MQVRTITELQSYWDSFSESYSTLDCTMNSFYFSMINVLELQTRSKILEVGAGAGFLFNHSLQRKPANAHYTATDLSEKMLQVLCRRMRVQDSGFSEGQSITNNEIGLTIEMANGEELKYASNSFDCYIANLCLQITTDPDKMIAEAFRVLQPGGVVGFTVWGEKDDSLFFTILPKSQQELDIPVPQIRTNFHLNDRNALIAKLEAAGFTEILCWNQFSPMHYRNEQHIEDLLNFSTFKTAIQAAGDKSEQLRQSLKDKLTQAILTNKKPIGMNGLIIIAAKPTQ